MRIIVLDVETGGFDSTTDSILSLGAVVLDDDGTIVDSFHTLIQEEEINANEGALKVNGLTIERLREQGLSPRMTVTLFTEFIRRNSLPSRPTLAGHNIAGFDMGFIRRLYRLAGARMSFDYHVLDTMSAALLLKWAGRLPVANVKLDTLIKHFDIVGREGEEHNALEDATLTAKLLVALRDMFTVGALENKTT